MCGIICSFSKERLVDLINKNSYRGQHSYSLYFPYSGKNIKSMGKVDNSLIEDGAYNICHIQAPTTESKGIDSIHPAIYNQNMLWHNGIIKYEYVLKMQDTQNTKDSWDTKLLLEILETQGFNGLDDIEGSFACIYKKNDIYYVFRNMISPLFINAELDISSSKYDGFVAIPPNIIHKLDIDNKQLIAIQSFNNKENPYFFGV